MFLYNIELFYIIATIQGRAELYNLDICNITYHEWQEYKTDINLLCFIKFNKAGDNKL